MNITRVAIGTLCGLMIGGCTHTNPAYEAQQTAKQLPLCQTIVSAYGHARPGYVSLDEWTKKKWDEDLAKFDKNGDGLIEKDEYVNSISGADPRTVASLNWAFKLWDRGNKGFVNEADERQSQRTYFSRQDADHDGWLSPLECAHYVPAQPCFC